jgi:hypothetical protein
MTLKIATWNMAHKPRGWDYIAKLGTQYGVDVALLQEVIPPSPEGADAPWRFIPAADRRDDWRISAPSPRKWTSAIVCMNTQLGFEPIPVVPLDDPRRAKGGQLVGASRPGSFAVAAVTAPTGATAVLVSAYGLMDGLAQGSVSCLGVSRSEWSDRRRADAAL